jgi:hypothetical protein
MGVSPLFLSILHKHRSVLTNIKKALGMKQMKLYFFLFSLAVFPLQGMSNTITTTMNNQEFRKVLTQNVVLQLMHSQCDPHSKLIKKFKLSKSQCRDGMKYAGFLCMHTQVNITYNRLDTQKAIIQKGVSVSQCIVKYFFSAVRYNNRFSQEIDH